MKRNLGMKWAVSVLAGTLAGLGHPARAEGPSGAVVTDAAVVQTENSTLDATAAKDAVLSKDGAPAVPPVDSADGSAATTAGAEPATSTAPSGRVVIRRAPDSADSAEAITPSDSGTLTEQSLTPVLSYSNTGATFLYHPPAGSRVADDVRLEAECGCDVTSYSVHVGGSGDGTGTFNAEVSLYNACPAAGGQQISGTLVNFNSLPNNIDADLVVDLSASPVSVPGTIWIRVRVTSTLGGWFSGSPAEVGFTDNVFDHPFTGCNTTFGGGNYAGFDAEVFCDDASSGPSSAGQPSPANGATGVAPDVLLTWAPGANRAAPEPFPAEGIYKTPEDVGPCGTMSPEEALAAVRRAVERGEIADPTKRRLPVALRTIPEPEAGAAVQVGTVTRDDLVIFEDADDLLANEFSDGQLFDLMAEASNVVLAQHGDNFDFVAFFLNFNASRQIGAAFYLGLENNVNGIGQSIFNNRPGFGVGGQNIEGWVMMWNQASWSTGQTSVTQLVLGQEFEHRFGMFLSSISGGRPLQGNNGACGRSGHWNFRADGQGSGMEIAEWVGSSPASRVGGTLNFNTDIGTPGVFSYPDLYLMGYVSPSEMDSGASELRYLDNNTNCTSPYNDVISLWGSADVIAANGVRSPNSLSAQKHFRTAWVVIHRPAAPPSNAQLDRMASILNDWSAVYEFSTLGLGSMDNTTVNFIPPCTTVFDVRFGTTNPPTDLICEGTPDTSCDPGLLECNATYFWQVVSQLAEESSAGPVWSFSMPVGMEDCNGNGEVDVCELALGTADDCQPDGIPDDCQIPPIAPASADCNANQAPDDCDLSSGVLHDVDGNGTPDECELFTPLPAAAPHDIRKNRYLSFNPNPANLAAVDIRLELLDRVCSGTGAKCTLAADCRVCMGGDNAGLPCLVASDCPGGTCQVSGESCNDQSSPALLGWVGEPRDASCQDLDTGAPLPGSPTCDGVNLISRVEPVPVTRTWPETLIHLGDCQIAPVQSYALSVTQGGGVFSERLVLGTIAKPQGKFWADVVGSFEGGGWTAPNGLVNVDDVVSWVKFVTFRPAPHVTVVDMAGEAPNLIINATDLSLILQGFQSRTYPPPPFANQGGPADCP